MNLTLVFALGVAATPAPITLWQNVDFGMTLARLQVAQPATVAIPADRKGHYLNSCAYTSGTVDIVGETMDVCYRMKDGRVAAVLLHNAKEASQITFGLLKPALAAKYGSPVIDDCSPISVGRLCKAVWKKSGLTITATDATILGSDAITVTYEAGASIEDNL
jgi:hypothetical protein